MESTLDRGCSSSRIAVPEDFARGVVNLAGDDGRRWIDRLPILVDSLCARWSLVVDGTAMHGCLGLVVPVRRGTQRCALKVSWIDESNAHEFSALSIWNGQGAVRLFETDPEIGAMLLERLDSRRSLADVEIGSALPIAGQLFRRLSVPAGDGLPLLRDVAEQLSETFLKRWESLNRPMPRPLVDAARSLASQLGPRADSLLVNYDLHYENVLAGEREPWLAIDPKAVIGDPEYGIAQLLWTRLEDIEHEGGLSHYFQVLVDQAELDLERARSWTLVRCVDYWLWALSVGLTVDPNRCKRITTWLTA